MEREAKIQSYLDKAWSFRRTGNFEMSKMNLINAHELCNDKDYMLLGRVFHIYRQYEADNKNYEKALVFNNTSLSYYKKSLNLDRIAHSLRHIADLQVKLNLFNRAKENYTKAIELYMKSSESNDKDLSNALRGFAGLLELIEQYPQAIQVWNKILILYEKFLFKMGTIEVKEKIMNLKNRI